MLKKISIFIFMFTGMLFSMNIYLAKSIGVTLAPSVNMSITGYIASKFMKKTHNKSLSYEFEQKVRGILKEVQYANHDKIILRNFDSQNLKLTPAFATQDAIFIDEKEFSSYSDDEIRFLIGHEAMHLINKDHKKRLCFIAIVPNLINATILTASNYLYKLSNDESLLDENISGLNHEIASWCASGTSLVSGILSWLKFVRNQEQLADAESIKRLKCAEGAIVWLKKFKDKHPDKWWKLTHPKTSDRIDFALKLLEKNN